MGRQVGRVFTDRFPIEVGPRPAPVLYPPPDPAVFDEIRDSLHRIEESLRAERSTQPVLLTVAGAAKSLQVSKPIINKLVREGKLKPIMLGPQSPRFEPNLVEQLKGTLTS